MGEEAGFSAELVSGIASSCVGTMSGQVVMQGFIHRQVPVFARRAITMLPALALIVFTRNRRIMGTLVNRPLTNVAAYVVAAVIVGLNVYLLTVA